MKIKISKLVLLSALGLSMPQPQIYGQERQPFTLDEIYAHTLQHNQSLQLSAGNLDLARQQVKVSQQTQLPTINATLSAFYLGDATILDSDLTNKTTVDMPNFGNSLVIQANQLVYKGSAIRNSIAVATLQEQMAQLDLDKNSQDIKLLVSNYYLELMWMLKQQQIFENNRELARVRLHNIEKMYEQGLVTNNDIIRTRLLISNLDQSLLQIGNNIEIINHQLVVAAGLPSEVKILPNEAMLSQLPQVTDLGQYQQEAASHNFDIRKALTSTEMAHKALRITQSERMPVISLFAANSLSRPITTATPALDMYTNGWQAGASLNFNISSLYKVPKDISMRKIQIEQGKRNIVLQQQNVETGVTTAYLRHQDALKQLETTIINLELANENYNITEKKYLNQLALQVDMLDASQVKLEAELQNTNANINVILSYIKLLYSTGKL